jgi:asparagine synthetase B (glutamine-hydrolysing)
MLEGEPSWLATFGPAECLATSARAPLLFRSPHSGYALHVALGDEATGPAVAERDQTAVIFDGILLDRGLLVSALGSGLPRGTEGDAALVLTAYLELGERVLRLLRGSFGLIIWDGRHDTLLCARDPTDSHPVFFSRVDRRVLVSSSHGALLGSGRVPADVDRVAIARWVVRGSILPRRTFYAWIERLPPGHLLTATPDAVGVRRYWHPRDNPPVGELTPVSVFERFEELLDQAIARCASAGRLGVFLSGGADSAVVAASAAVVGRARSLPDPLALSCIYPDPDANEEVAQRTVAGALGIPQRLIPLANTVGREGLLAAALRLTERSWMPCVNPWEPVFVHLAETGADLGCKAILSGEGGNDWFETEWYEAADLIRRCSLIGLLRLWSQERRAGRSGAATARALFWASGLRVLVRDAALAAANRVDEGGVQAMRRRRLLASLPRSWALPDGDLRAALRDELLEGRSSDRRGSYRETATERTLEGMHLVVPMENRFLYGRRAGVRFFNPAVDPDLVEFLYGLPSALLNLGGRGKGLAWESVRHRVGDDPAAVLGFADVEGFLGSLVRGEGRRALEALGGLERLAELGIVDESEFARSLFGPGLGVEMRYYQAWQALACEAWLRRQR